MVNCEELSTTISRSNGVQLPFDKARRRARLVSKQFYFNPVTAVT